MNELVNTQNVIRSSKYLYLIRYRREYKQLCALEMKSLFGTTSSMKHHFMTENFPLSRSSFLKERIEILYCETDITILESKMVKDNLSFEQYKIQYIVLDDVPYSERLNGMRKLGTAIEGSFAIQNPLVKFALTKVDGYWIFGFYQENEQAWISRRQKPFNYSHALEVKLAKAIVNIAICNQFDISIVDPCCGIGTVIIEAKSIGLNIQGYELNELVANHCNENLRHFGFTPDVKRMDMQLIKEHYDVAILDIPYGQFSTTTLEEQIQLIRKTSQISNRSVIISMDDMSETIKKQGLTIQDVCIIEKSNAFKRYITVCTSNSLEYNV